MPQQRGEAAIKGPERREAKRGSEYSRTCKGKGRRTPRRHARKPREGLQLGQAASRLLSSAAAPRLCPGPVGAGAQLLRAARATLSTSPRARPLRERLWMGHFRDNLSLLIDPSESSIHSRQPLSLNFGPSVEYILRTAGPVVADALVRPPNSKSGRAQA